MDGTGGTALEVNFDYVDPRKAMQDLIKLMDPANRFAEAIYVVVGKRRTLQSSVEEGLAEAARHLHARGLDATNSRLRVLLVHDLGPWRYLCEGEPIVAAGGDIDGRRRRLFCIAVASVARSDGRAESTISAG